MFSNLQAELSETSGEESKDGSMPELTIMLTTLGGIPETDNISNDDLDWFSEVGEDAGELDDEGWNSEDEDIPHTHEFTLEEYGLDFSDLPEVALVVTEPAKPGQYAYIRHELYN